MPPLVLILFLSLALPYQACPVCIIAKAYPVAKLPSFHRSFHLKVIGSHAPFILLLPYTNYNISNSLVNNNIVDSLNWLNSPLVIALSRLNQYGNNLMYTLSILPCLVHGQTAYPPMTCYLFLTFLGFCTAQTE